jgi:hypothetical protein
MQRMKSKRSFVTVLIFLAVLQVAQAQDYGIGKQQIGRPSRFAIGIMGSPDFQGHLMVAANAEEGREAASLLRRTEKPGFGYTTGIHIQYDLKSRWFMRLGFYYSDKKVNQSGSVTGFNTIPAFIGLPTGSRKSPFGFLEIPLTFHYYLNTPYEKNRKGLCFNDFTQHNQGKPLFYVFAGPALAVNIASHVYDSRRWTKTNDTLFVNTLPVYADPFTVFYAGGYAGIGVLKYFGKHFFASAELTTRYFPFNWYGRKLLRNAEEDSFSVPQPVSTYPVKDQPYSIGLQLAINYHF